MEKDAIRPITQKNALFGHCKSFSFVDDLKVTREHMFRWPMFFNEYVPIVLYLLG